MKKLNEVVEIFADVMAFLFEVFIFGFLILTGPIWMGPYVLYRYIKARK